MAEGSRSGNMPNGPDQTALIEALRRSDPGAIVRFFRLHEPPLVQYCRRLTRNSDAEDLAMVVLEQFLLRYVHVLSHARAIPQLLQKMAYRRWLAYRESPARRLLLVGGNGELAEELREAAPRLEQAIASGVDAEEARRTKPRATKCPVNRASETDEQPRAKPSMPFDPARSSDHQTPEDGTHYAEALELLTVILDELGERKREIMLVHIYQPALTRQEVGEICGVSGPYVSMIIEEVWQRFLDRRDRT